MRRKLNLLLGILWMSLMGQAQLSQQVIPLDKNWEFSEARQEKWQEAVVPGTVHQDLLRLNQLPDPFYGTNEQKIQWVEDKDWEYRTSFTLTPEQVKYAGAVMSFEGLDTYADVYLNGSLILSADNMFVGYEVPVREVLKAGENRLHIYFYSPVNKVLPQWESNGFDYPADNDHHDKHTSVFTRKAPYHYGWDWGIRMAGCGVWRPVNLLLFQVSRIEDYCIRQLRVDRERAEVEQELQVFAVGKEKAEVIYTCLLNGKKVKSVTQPLQLEPGENSVKATMIIEHPELWMPLGWGKPTLYDFQAEVRLADGTVVAEKTVRTGLRSLRVVHEEDKDGKSFYIEVNGRPMFAKGANYIPNDIILTNVKKEDYDRLFQDIVSANMNMIRVWGGGVYEDDYFYRLADENGILIWQDFMFGCTSYPADPAFLKLVEEEAVYNIRRLRNHPCLALWCGNNEVIEAIKYWGWEKRYGKEVHQSMFAAYDKLFRELLPRKVKELDPGRFYIHSSPDSANWGRPASLGWGDSHYWGVWYGIQPFEILDTRLSRFMSEFGFQAFPEMKVISTFAAPEDYALESEVMKAHQKSSIGNKFIRTYMDMYYHVPERFEDFVYVGLVLQGQGMRHGMEAHRRNRPYCMGTLYWQLNDSWPVVSWSGIDYFGNWKALHYQAQRAFAPILINAIQEKGQVNFYLLSDRLEEYKDLTLEYEMIDFAGKVIKQEKRRVDLPANRSVCVWQNDSAAMATLWQRKNTFLSLVLKDRQGRELNRQLFYFEHPKFLNLPETEVKQKVRYEDGYCEVTLTSKALAKDVFIEIPVQGARFSDNFFDLLPGVSRKIRIVSPLLKKQEPQEIKVKHLRQTYR